MGRISNRAKIDGGGSATAFAADTYFRWNLEAFAIAWSNMTSSATMTFIEVDASQSAVAFQFVSSTTNGFINMYLGPNGQEASAAASRLIFNTGTIGGTVTGFFVGHYG